MCDQLTTTEKAKYKQITERTVNDKHSGIEKSHQYLSQQHQLGEKRIRTFQWKFILIINNLPIRLNSFTNSLLSRRNFSSLKSWHSIYSTKWFRPIFFTIMINFIIVYSVSSFIQSPKCPYSSAHYFEWSNRTKQKT